MCGMEIDKDFSVNEYQLKNLMTKVEKSDQMRDTIIGLLHNNLEELIQNPYGNYAVQHALDVKP